MRGILILLIIKWLFENFSQLNPQVQSGWIAGLTAMTATVLTVGITQYFASRNLKKTLAENRETAQETQRENKEALDRTLEANENNLNRTLASNKETLERTLEADAQKHRAELAERRADRLYEKRLDIATKCSTAIHRFSIQHELSQKLKESEDLLKIFSERQGEIVILFSPEVEAKALNIQTGVIAIKVINFNMMKNQKKLEALKKTTGSDKVNQPEIKKLQESVTQFSSDLDTSLEQLTEQCVLFNELVTKALGTYQEFTKDSEA